MKGIISSLRKNLFYSVSSSVLTIVLFAGSIFLAVGLFRWAVFNAVWSGTAEDCRKSTGACWAFIAEKINFIMVGFYPQEEIWRPTVALFFFLGLAIYVSLYKYWNKYTLPISTVLFIVIGVLLYGGIFGLPTVAPQNWGGLILTIILTTVGCVVAYPIGILLALGRVSKLPVVRTSSVVYIELIRGVPLISLLFMASVMLPFILPQDWKIDKVARAQIAIILFTGAYMAEIIRGGLQAIPKGQYEAAASLGLKAWHSSAFIVLPQALKIVIPPTVGVFIALFQDTTLVIIISMYDLLGTAKAALTDSKWLGFSREAYFFLIILFFLFCYSMALYSNRLEKKLNVDLR